MIFQVFFGLRSRSRLAHQPESKADATRLEQSRRGRLKAQQGGMQRTHATKSCRVTRHCFSRCEKKYGGKVKDKEDAYFCAKGCAGMSSGKVKDPDKRI
eukprot:gene2931-14345_t